MTTPENTSVSFFGSFNNYKWRERFTIKYSVILSILLLARERKSSDLKEIPSY